VCSSAPDPVVESQVDALAPRVAKRFVDVVVAALLLALALPLFAIVSLVIKAESRGPVFFRQRRLGQWAREFTMLKFRTMKPGTSSDEHREYIQASMRGDALPAAGGVFKLEREQALTRLGSRLRRSSLDELPQLVNVLRGEMSLVGPRPCLPYETEHFLPHHFERFRVPQGMTGLWQVEARGRATFRAALELDVEYARRRSLALDLRLLARTPLQLLRTKATR
jgi:lipopolysaccharide/colanic/teichoic acid biosynthesis glycosyltransferase